MEPTLRQLKTLITVFELKSITKASEKLHLTQPAITTQIKNLESLTGEELVIKSGRGIAFTEKAREIVQYAYRVDDAMDKLNAVICREPSDKKENLKIMLKISSMPIFFHLLKQFCNSRGGNVDLTVNVGSSFTQLLSGIVSRQFDLVTIAIPSSDPNINFVPLFSYKIFIAVAKDHPLAELESVSIEQLQEEKFVIGEVDTVEYRVFNQYFEKYNFNKLYMSNNLAVRYALRNGFGVGIIPTFNQQLDLDLHGLKAIPVDCFPVEETLYMAYLKDNDIPPVAHAFIDFVKATTDKESLFNLKP